MSGMTHKLQNKQSTLRIFSMITCIVVPRAINRLLAIFDAKMAQKVHATSTRTLTHAPTMRRTFHTSSVATSSTAFSAAIVPTSLAKCRCHQSSASLFHLSTKPISYARSIMVMMRSYSICCWRTCTEMNFRRIACDSSKQKSFFVGRRVRACCDVIPTANRRWFISRSKHCSTSVHSWNCCSMRSGNCVQRRPNCEN